MLPFRTVDNLILSAVSIFKTLFILSFICFAVLPSSKNTDSLQNKVLQQLVSFLYTMPRLYENDREDFQTDTEIYELITKVSGTMPSSQVQKLAKLIKAECEIYGLDPLIILAVIQVESSFSPKAVSNKGALGLMQLKPNTAKFAAKELGIPYGGSKSLYDPLTNVRLGIYYLSFLAEEFNSVEYALTAYNYGPTRFRRTKSFRTSHPSYVRKVLSFKTFLEEERQILRES